MTAEIKFECGTCGQSLVVETDGQPRNIACPACQSRLAIPASASASAPAELEPTLLPPPETLRESIVRATMQATRLERELGEALAEHQRLQAAVQTADEQRNQIIVAAAETQSELRHEQARAELLQQELANAQARVAEFETYSVALEQNASQARHAAAAEAVKVAESETALTVARSEIEKLHLTLAQSGEEAQRRESSLIAARLQITELERLRADSERVIHSLMEEAAVLRHDLQHSDAGAELLRLRSEIHTLQTERSRQRFAHTEADRELAKLRETEFQLRREIADLRQQCADARRQADAVSQPQLQADNEVLRGIVTRHKEELARCYSDIAKFRRARFHMHVAYALFGLALAAIVALTLLVLTDIGNLLSLFKAPS